MEELTRKRDGISNVRHRDGLMIIRGRNSKFRTRDDIWTTTKPGQPQPDRIPPQVPRRYSERDGDV